MAEEGIKSYSIKKFVDLGYIAAGVIVVGTAAVLIGKAALGGDITSFFVNILSLL